MFIHFNIVNTRVIPQIAGEPALDTIISERVRNRLTVEANDRFGKSGVAIRDAYGTVDKWMLPVLFHSSIYSRMCRHAKFRLLASHGTPSQHSKIPHRCDTRRRCRSGDHKKGRRRVV